MKKAFKNKYILLAIFLIFTSAIVIVNYSSIISNAETFSDSDFTFVLNSTGDGYILTKFNKSTGVFSRPIDHLEIPSSHYNLPVVEIGAEAFKNKRITEIIIPEGVEAIGSGAFNLTTTGILYPKKDLNSLFLPSTLKFIGSNAFTVKGGSNLSKLAYNGTISEWCNIQFEDENSNPMRSGADFYLPADFNQGETANWRLLYSTYLENDIWKESYLYFKLIREISIPDDVETISPYCFNNFDSIFNFYLNNTKTISNNAFSGCGFNSIVIPSSVSEIDGSSFSNCKCFTDFFVDDNNTYYSSADGVLYDKAGTGLLIFPSGRTVSKFEISENTVSIGENAFYSITSLNQIVVPSSVQYIGNNAFPQGFYNTYSGVSWLTSSSVYIYCKQDSYTQQFCIDKKIRYSFYVDMYYDAKGGVMDDIKKRILLNSAMVGTNYNIYSTSIGIMPSPQKDGYTFFGWYSDENGGGCITPSTTTNSSYDFTVYACWAETESLKCGEKIKWKLDGNKLVVSGAGDMYNYGNGQVPWMSVCNYIYEIEIEEKVEALSDYSFNQLSDCQKITSFSPLCEFPTNYSNSGYRPIIVGYSGSDSERFAGTYNLSFRSLGDCGECGDGLIWTYQPSAQTLSVLCYSGNGRMDDYDAGITPWNDYKSEITNVVFDDSVTYIGNNALYNFSNVNTINFPNGLTGLGANVVENTQWYSDRNGSIVTVGNFLYAYKIKNDDIVVIGNGITGVAGNFGSSIKASGNGPESIQISRSVSVIQDGALSNNPDLTELYVDKGNRYYKCINNVLYSKNGKELICYPAGLDGAVSIPDSVTTIRPYAFAGCTNLTEITIGKNVVSIDYTSFDSTSLETIYGYAGSFAQTFAAENGYQFVPFQSTVHLDCNGGLMNISGNMFDQQTISIDSGTQIGELSIPEKDGYTFKGWYYETDEDDILVTESFIVEDNMTLYAYWEKIIVTAPYITEIQIKTNPVKNTYFAGETLDTRGLVLSAIYSNGDVLDIDSGFYCVPYLLNISGSQSISVFYSGKTTSFTVGVAKVVPTSISIISEPVNQTFYLGDEFNPLGLTVSVSYNNGTTKTIRDTSLLNYEYDFDSAEGSVPVSISYSEGERTVTAVYEVNVVNTPRVYSQSANVNAGDTFGIPVYISGNEGLMGYCIEIRYNPEAFEPDGVEGGYSSGSFNTDIGYGKDGCLKIIWNDSADYSEDGILFTAIFDALPRAQSGTYPFEISYSKSDTFNENYSEVSLDCIGTTVAVTGGSAVPELYSDNQVIDSGNSFDLPVYIKNGTGFEDLSTITVSYDSEQFDYIETNQYNEENVLKIASNGHGTVRFVLNETENTDDEVFANLRFAAKSTASGEYRFRIESNDSRWRGSTCVVNVNKVTITPSVFAQDTPIRPNSRIEIPIQISNNTGLMGFQLVFDYHSDEMQFVDAVLDEKWEGFLEYYCNNETIRVIWTGNENVVDDGTILYLIFDTLDHIPYDNCEVSIRYEYPDTFNENWDNVRLDCRDVLVFFDKTDLVFHSLTYCYYENGTQKTESFEYYVDEPIIDFEVPEKENYCFAGWSPAVPGRMEDEDLVVEAVYIPINYTISFIVDDTVIMTREYNIETTSINEPEIPLKPNCFAKWQEYTLENGGDLEVHAIYESPTITSLAQKTLHVGETYRIITSGNYVVTRSVWRSDNEEVATVDNRGVVTAVGIGTATITVTKYGKDGSGNEVYARTSTVIKVTKEKVEYNDFGEWLKSFIERFFDEIFYDILENLKRMGIILSYHVN